MFSSSKSLHLQMGNVTAFCYIIKMGGGGNSQNKLLTHLPKKNWDCLISIGIMITAEYLPKLLNKNYQSRAVSDPSEWKLNPKVFEIIFKECGAIFLLPGFPVRFQPDRKLDPYRKGLGAFHSS